MNTASAKLMVYVNGPMACIKIAGRANFTSSVDFKLLVEELSENKVRRIVLDLSECVLMDSTFLGVLAGFGLGMSKEPQAGQSIELMDPSPRISELLENLGVMHLFKIITSADIAKEDGHVPVPVPAAQATREEITATCLKAHQTLMGIDPANVNKFKEVTQFLAEDLKKMKNGR